MARIALVNPKEASGEAKEVFDKLEAGGVRVLNLYRTLAVSPPLLRNVVRLGNSLLLKTSLPARLREITILRVAHLTGSAYEARQHVPLALKAGLTEAQIKSIGAVIDPQFFTAPEMALLRYVEAVTRRVSVSDKTFAGLKKHFDERAVLELTVLAGYYGLLARVLVGLDVDLEQGVRSIEELTGRSKDKPEAGDK